MMRQWSDIKADHPDCIVLFRLGDFYEAFNEDAAAVADVCDVVLTSRPVRKGQRVPMAGVPYHAVDGYIAQLVRAGRKVAIVEQSGSETSPEKRARMSRRPSYDDPAPAATGGGRQILEREVVRVVTAGTLVEGDLLDERANNYLTAVADADGSFGLAYADVTTGEFATTVIAGTDAERRLLDELVRLRPAELLVRSSLLEADGLPGFGASFAGRLATALDLAGCAAAMMPLPDWRLDAETARRALLDHFGTASLAAYGCDEEPLAAAAAGGVLAYVKETQRGAVAQLAALSTYSTEAYMALDAATRRNLEITGTIRDGRRRGSLLWVLDRTRTALGARLLRSWLDRPLVDAAAIDARLDAVEALVGDSMLRAELREALSGMPDLERLTNRVVAGYAGPRELQALATGLRTIPALSDQLRDRSDLPDMLRSRCGQDVSPVSDLVDASVADEPPVALGVAGVVRAGFDEELDAIHASVAEARDWIAGLEAVERERTGIAKLKVGYNKVFGYYLAVPKSKTNDVPDDYVRKQTLVDSERYITPELKERESEVLHAEERIIALERRLFGQVVERVADAAPEILAAARDVAAIDCLAALAEIAVANRYARPEVYDDRDLVIEGGRHPVVERVRQDQPFVPNDVAIADGEIVLLTGPNMAGKSTIGRQVALTVLMAQIGSYVPADAARVGLVDRIFTRIGAQDEIAAGQSTFMVEMVETAGILNHASPRSLIVLDELGRGTSTYDGIAIAWAVIEHIHNHPRLGARTLFATHYHELTALEDLLPRVRNMSMAVTDTGDGVVFLHRIERGAADRSYGVHVAELAGLPRDVVGRAWEILGRLEAEGNVPLQGTERRPPPSESTGQLALFAPFDVEHPVVEALKALDVDSMTPLEALTLLYELRRQSRVRGPGSEPPTA